MWGLAMWDEDRDGCYFPEPDDLEEYNRGEADDYRDEGVDIFEDVELLGDLFNDILGNQEEWDDQ